MLLRAGRLPAAAVLAARRVTSATSLGLAPQLLPWSEYMQAAVTAPVTQHLEAKGFAVVDGALPPAAAAALRAEIAALEGVPGALRQNCTHLVRPGALAPDLLPKARILEAEVSLDPAARSAAPLLAAIDADRSLGALLSVFLPRLALGGHGVKAQVNTGGGGAFPMHADTDEELDSRKVTAIFYLNPEWRPGDGGELRLYPFPSSPPVDVAPLAGRMVLFSTARMHHRVLPSVVPRYCFTVWLSQGRGGRLPRAAGPPPRPLPPPPDAEGPEADAAVVRFLLHPAVRPHVAKLVYAGEWRASLRESHTACEATDAVLRQHDDGVERAQRALAPYLRHVERLAAACAAGGAAAPCVEGAEVSWF